MIPVQQVSETKVKVNDNETKTDKTIATYNHMDGNFTPSSRESIVEHQNGNATTTDTVVQQPAGNFWLTQARISTTRDRRAGWFCPARNRRTRAPGVCAIRPWPRKQC